MNNEAMHEGYNYWDNIKYDRDICKKYYKRYLNLINRIHNRIITYDYKMIKGN